MMNDSSAVLIAEHLNAKSRVGSDLRNVTIRIMRGEIHAILGDHDSGKDSFADLLSGGNCSFRGTLKFENREIRNWSRATAIELGIQTIYKTPQLIPSLSVLNNIYPKKRIKKSLFLDDVSSMRDVALQKLALFSIKLDLNAAIEACTENEKLIVCIVRSLCAPCKMLIVDEVTQRLSPTHVDALKAELSVRRQRGTTVLYLTSNVSEVHNFADRISFFDKGQLTATRDVAKLDRFDLVRLSYTHLYERKELETTSFELFFLKSYYESVVRSMPTPLLITNRDGRVTFVNKLFCICFSIGEDAVIDRNITELLSHAPDGRFDVLETPEHKKRDVMKFSKLLLNLKKEKVPTEVYVAPIIDSGDSIMGHVILFSDNSHSRLQIESYRRMLHENKRIPFLAHEIRNPLGIIRNFLNLLRSKQMSEESRECFLWIEKEVKRIDHLVGDLIAESMDARRITGRKKVELGRLIEDIRKIVVSPIRGKTIEFVNEIPMGESVDYDEKGLREVMINLIINAVEAIAKHGRIRVASNVLSVNGKKYFAIHVTDNGKGIEEAVKREIFNPFVSTKKGKEKRGLGLSICKDIVEGWGGFISTESSPGFGSTFRVHLPF